MLLNNLVQLSIELVVQDRFAFMEQVFGVWECEEGACVKAGLSDTYRRGN